MDIKTCICYRPEKNIFLPLRKVFYKPLQQGQFDSGPRSLCSLTVGTCPHPPHHHEDTTPGSACVCQTLLEMTLSLSARMKPSLLVTFSNSLQLCFCPAFTLFPGSLAPSISQMVKNEGKGAKRKTSEEEKNGSEELVEKKVCKGFQTV